MKIHDNHSITLQAMCLLGLRWEPFPNDPVRGELCFGGLRYSTELDRLGCPILPQCLLVNIVPKIRAFHEQPWD